VPILRVVALVGLVQVLMSPNGWLYTSQGRTDLMFRWGSVAAAASVASFAIGVAIGTLEAVALSYLVANVVILGPSLYLSGRTVGVRVREVLSTASAPAFCTAVMVLSVWIVTRQLPPSLGIAWLLLIQVGWGGIVYVATLTLLKPIGFRELQKLVKGRSRVVNGRMASVAPVLD
jgi:O-antigen/teichoic acid export membrane protein